MYVYDVRFSILNIRIKNYDIQSKYSSVILPHFFSLLFFCTIKLYHVKRSHVPVSVSLWLHDECFFRLAGFIVLNEFVDLYFLIHACCSILYLKTFTVR